MIAIIIALGGATKKDIERLEIKLFVPTMKEVESEINKQNQFIDKFEKERALEFYKKGIDSYERGLFKKANSQFSKAIDISPVPSLFINRGNAHLKNN